MEKAIGYFELKVGDQVIPLKFGMYAMDLFCEVLKVDTDSIMTLFKEVPNHLQEGKTMPVPKNYIKFMSTAIWAGACYASRVEGGKPLDIMQAYEWIDKLGIYSEQVTSVFSEFYFAALTGRFRDSLPSDSEKKSEA